ncbi:hypothetical protein Trydic_g9878 [Trypoxylus dichotomus]
MSYDDIVYLSLLFFCIALGYFYRQIKSAEQKKWLGTGAGLVVVLIVSGVHIIHSLVTYLINAIIILLVNKRKCHLVSFTFSFLYLFFFRSTVYFGIPYPPAHTNLVQMIMTLKLVGLAFEVNSSYQLKKKRDTANKTVEEKLEDETNDINPSLLDIFHYTFNYIGVLTGPYYRYRTFRDYFNLPFAESSPWKDATIQKIVYVPIYATLFLLSTSIWPLSYALTEEFDTERSWLYRFWYIWPTFFMFRMRIYIGIVLSECVCTMAGFGAYPEFTNPQPGLGPSKNFQKLKELTENPTKVLHQAMNFETIRNVSPYGSDFCTTFREGMKHWNICVQYWLAVNIYKRFPSKKYRTFVTMLVSAAWHGMYIGYYVCIGCAPLYLLIEDVWVQLVLKDYKGKHLKLWEWIFWYFKMAGFSYLAIAFNLLSIQKVIHYYNSIYHAGAIIGVILYLSGLHLLMAKKAKEQKKAIIQVDITAPFGEKKEL